MPSDLSPFPTYTNFRTVDHDFGIFKNRGLSWQFQGHSSATSCEEGNKTLARRRHDVVR